MNNDLFFAVTAKAGDFSYDLSLDIASLTVEENESGPALLTVEIPDPYKIYSHALREGTEIGTDLGVVSDHSVIFKGRIAKTEGRFHRHEIPFLRILAYDQSMNMGLRKRNRIWTETSLEKIVHDIADDYFSENEIKVELKGNPGFTGNGIRQRNETDLAFLLRLGSAYGCELFVASGEQESKLHFKSQYKIMQEEPLVTLYHDRSGAAYSLLSFDADADISKIQLPRVFAGSDYDTGKFIQQVTVPIDIVGDVTDSFADENLALFSERYPERADSIKHLLTASEKVYKKMREELGSVKLEISTGFTTQDELSKKAENQFSSSIYGMRANGSTAGNHRIHAQSTIRIENVGGRFSGNWYLSQVRHILNREGYLTEFQCRR